MSATQSTAEVPTRGFYFFLSHAHTPPTPDQETTRPDLWVTTLYHDLSTQVTRLARRGSRLDAGFMEGQVPPAPNWQEQVSRALSSAEVFVPLYSPTYLRRSWPLSERAAFRARLATVGPERSRGHVQPVIWVPLAPGEETADLDDALELGSRVPEYARNGLLAMCRLSIFRDRYAAVVRILAERIVRVAEHAPIGPSPTSVSIEFTPPSPDQTSFVIGVIAPTADVLPATEGPAAYGDLATHWHPFEDVAPAAEYAAGVAQRLGLGADTVDISTNADSLAANAGIMLVDPWILAVTGGRTRLQAAIKTLPEWVVLLIVAGEQEPVHVPRGDSFFADVVDILSEHQQHVVKVVRDAGGFIGLMPSVVTQARRRFLSRARMFPPGHALAAGHTRRSLPRLGDS